MTIMIALRCCCDSSVTRNRRPCAPFAGPRKLARNLNVPPVFPKRRGEIIGTIAACGRRQRRPSGFNPWGVALHRVVVSTGSLAPFPGAADGPGGRERDHDRDAARFLVLTDGEGQGGQHRNSR